MKFSPENRFLLAAISLTLTAPAAFAANLTWDTVDDGTGITAGSGAWDLSATNWNDPAGNVAWSQVATNDASNAAIFAGADGTLDEYVVTIGATTMAAESLTFNSSGYLITGGTLAIKPASSGNNGPIVVAANKTATINSAIAYNNNTGAGITAQGGAVLNLGGGASNAQYNFGGGGTVNITGGTYQANTGQINTRIFNQTGGDFGLNQGNNVGYEIGRNAGQNVTYTISGGTLSSNANSTAHTAAWLNIGRDTGNFTSTLRVQTGGTVEIGTTRAGQLRIGGTANSNGVLDVQGGTLTVGTNKPLNKLYFFIGGADADRSAVMTQSGGTVTAGGIQFGGTTGTYDAASSASLTLSGGSLNIGADGITRGSAASALPTTIQLQGGTLGSTANWSSDLNMALGTTDGGPTINTSGGNINLSGNLTNDGAVDGTLTKAGGGDLVLTGTNNYSGGTTVTGGRLFISSAGALPTTGAVQVGNGGDDRIIFNVSGSPTFNQSITLASGAALVVRNDTTLTNVILPTAGSVVFQKDNAATVGFTLNSNVALSGDLTIQVGGGSTAPTEGVTLAGDFSGGFGLIKDQVGELVISGTSTYTGDTLVNNGTLTLASGGGLSFTVGASGVNNQISGDATPGTVSLDGIFSFDLSSAGTTFGDLWNIVDLANLGTVTFGSNFEVADFMDAGGGLWNRNFGGADYQFSTTSGQLAVIPEPHAALLGGLGLLALLRRRRA